MLLLDTHHHLDFLPDAARPAFLAAVADQGVRVVAQTLTPSSFLTATARTPERPEPSAALWSVGLHPWWIRSAAHAEEELALLPDCLTRTRFVGEVGLDLSPRRAAQADAGLQRRVFRTLLSHVAAAAADATADAPLVLSVHAVRSANDVLDALDELGASAATLVPVFHRFSGTSEELTRLIRRGGHVSVHPQMLAGKRGRAYVRQVPADRLLLESDLPGSPVEGPDADALAADAAAELVASLRGTLQTLEDLRGEDVRGALQGAQARLYGVA